jgi:hypothetical protein
MRQVVSRKFDSSYGLGKKDKLSFYSHHYKYRFTVKLGHAYVLCRDVHAKFLFRIFSHFQIYFLNKESIYTLDQICISQLKFALVFQLYVGQFGSVETMWFLFTWLHTGSSFCRRTNIHLWIPRLEKVLGVSEAIGIRLVLRQCLDALGVTKFLSSSVYMIYYMWIQNNLEYLNE